MGRRISFHKSLKGIPSPTQKKKYPRDSKSKHLNCFHIQQEQNSNSATYYYHQLPSTDQDNTSLFVAIAVPLILICILFVTLLFLRRRRFLCKRATDARANDNMSLPDSTMETSRPVLIKNFAEHYRIMSADSDFRFVGIAVHFDLIIYVHTHFISLQYIDLVRNSKNLNMLDVTSHAHLPICHVIDLKIASQTSFHTTIHDSNYNLLMMMKDLIT